MPQMAKAENTRRTYRIVVRVARQTCLNPLLAAGADVAAILVSKHGRGLTPGQAPRPQLSASAMATKSLALRPPTAAGKRDHLGASRGLS